MNDASALDFLISWFAAHCDGDWEHDLGIRLETLDNPGWAIDVRIADTELEGLTAPWQQTEVSDNDWLHWRSTGAAFEARCGPQNLHQALAAFEQFAHGRHSSTARPCRPVGGAKAHAV